MLELEDPVTKIPLIGPIQAQKLKKLKIETVKDLLHHYPHRYEDFSQIKPTIAVKVGEQVTVKGNPTLTTPRYTRTGKNYTLVHIEDKSGHLQALWWNQPWIRKSLKPNQEYYFSGRVNFFNRKLTLINPQFEEEGKDPIHTSSLVPIYPETEGLSSKWLRSRIAATLKILGYQNYLTDTDNMLRENDFLPPQIRQKYNLLYLPQALYWIHFPESKAHKRQAHCRLAFDELFQLQLRTQKRCELWGKKKPVYMLNLSKHKKRIKDFISSLPFNLTEAQKQVTQEIIDDLQKNTPMNRLLQGDVGSGKTVVAAIATYATYLEGFKTLFMAPTEILAEQHYKTLRQLFKHLRIKVELLTGNHKPTSKALQQSDIIIGTHAIFYNSTELADTGLTIIDEQHRFGVKQRAKLVEKSSNNRTSQQKSPHLLSLTATPIPRSVALTLYGDQDLSLLNEMPPGRKPIKTWVVPGSKRADALEWVKKQIINHKHQAFIICPLIEESEHETFQSVKAATVEFEKLQKDHFPELKLGLVHGKLKSKEKATVLDKFREGIIQVLVATPVVEVGLDIPRANIMIIEGAERFGLASLHQLRGRIGRRGKQAYCFLFTSTRFSERKQRLKALERCHNGLKLAEIDLQLRGPGELFGIKQHGFLDLKLANLNNLSLIEITKQAVLEYREIVT